MTPRQKIEDAAALNSKHDQKPNKDPKMPAATRSAPVPAHTPTPRPEPKQLTREEMKAIRATKEEEMRQKMMEEATHNLEYLKTLRYLAEKTSCGSDKVKTEMMSYFNTKILDLETDVMGKPRYSYNLHYPTDIGFAPNGRPPVFADKKFSSVAEISKFISEYVKENDMMFDKDTYYNIPMAKMLESMFYDNDKISNNVPLEIDINDEDEDEDEEKVPPFTVTRMRINY